MKGIKYHKWVGLANVKAVKKWEKGGLNDGGCDEMRIL
jgi:hypothetical protein